MERITWTYGLKTMNVYVIRFLFMGICHFLSIFVNL